MTVSTLEGIRIEYSRTTDLNWEKFLSVATDPQLQGVEVKPTGRLRTMMSALATGWLPWGREWEPTMALCQDRFILCCNHTLTPQCAGKLAAAGLVEPSLDKHGRKAIQITDAGRAWLIDNWIS